jgi:hypothetical protein
MNHPKDKKKEEKQFKKYDLFFMQFGFKDDKRIRDRSNFSESKFWEKYIKEDKKKL